MASVGKPDLIRCSGAGASTIFSHARQTSLRPVCNDHAVLGRDHVEPLGSLFADHMHRLLATRAVCVGRRNPLVNAWQMGRQRATVDPPFPRRIGGNLRLLLDRVGLGGRLLEVFQRQIELIGMKLGEPLALRLEALRLAQQPTQAVVEFDQSVALGDSRIALGNRVQRNRPQRINVVGNQSIGWFTRQAQHILDDLPEPNLRLTHFTAGAGTRRARARIQSRPSINPANCAADSRMTPSSMRGQRNFPPSNLLANRHRPVPSQKIKLDSLGTLSAEAEVRRRERIGLQLLLHQRRKSVHPFAEVHGLRRHQNPDRPWRNQHSAAHALKRRIAHSIASTSRRQYRSALAP